MLVCQLILNIISTVVRTIILVVRLVVETVCSWVSSIITTVVEVMRKVCRWLPWPLNKLCNWVADLVEVVQVVWDWVCEEVIKKIIDYIEVFWIYVEYALQWVCWFIDWVLFKWWRLLLCLWTKQAERCIKVCVKVTVDSRGVPVITNDEVLARIAKSNEILEQCNLKLELQSIEFVDQHIENVSCSAGGIFSEHFIWFNREKCFNGDGLTVFYVDSISGSSDGCSIPPSDWIALESGSNVGDIVHELGHLSDLFGHHDDPNNVMHASGAGTELTKTQCCMIRISKFSRACNRYSRSLKTIGHDAPESAEESKPTDE